MRIAYFSFYIALLMLLVCACFLTFFGSIIIIIILSLYIDFLHLRIFQTFSIHFFLIRKSNCIDLVMNISLVV